MKLMHIISNMRFKIEDIGKDMQTNHSYLILPYDMKCTRVFCSSLAFCESMCGACMFIVIGHLLSSMYNCFTVHVGFHNHRNAKGKN